jgi:acyl transferase domain-containing protein
VVVAGLGLSMGGAAHREEARAALLSGQEPAPGATEVSLPLQGNRFPPHDLALTLPQHTLLLGAAIEAAADVGEALPANTGVFIGMGTDPTVARYGARWRLPQRAAALGASADWARAVADQLAPPLQSAAVLGTMPNLPANRISFQLGLGGPSFTVAAEQHSGAVALSRAIAALEDGELDAAVVGAVDLSADPLHAAAAAAQGVTDTAGDGAAVLILRREGEAALPWGPLR